MNILILLLLTVAILIVPYLFGLVLTQTKHKDVQYKFAQWTVGAVGLGVFYMFIQGCIKLYDISLFIVETYL